jgi:hypothetical protein
MLLHLALVMALRARSGSVDDSGVRSTAAGHRAGARPRVEMLLCQRVKGRKLQADMVPVFLAPESQTELLQHSAGDCAHFEKMAAAPQGPGRLLPHIISSCSCGWMSYLRAVLVRVRQSLENLGDCCCVVELELS